MTSQGDLLLVPFPFSDQNGRKVRPVLVISNNQFNESSEDILVIAVTSNIMKDRYAISLTDKDLEEGHLLTKCSIKCESLLKIDKEIIIKKIGKIKDNKLNLVRAIIIKIIT